MKNYMLFFLFCLISISAIGQHIVQESAMDSIQPVDKPLQNIEEQEETTTQAKGILVEKPIVKKTRKEGLNEMIIASSTEIMNTSKNYVGIIPALSGKNGVKVLQVIEDSPAAMAGIKVGDLIRELDGKIVRSINLIAKTMHMKAEGQTIEWTVRKEGVESIISIRLEKNEDYQKGAEIIKVKKNAKEKLATEPISLILNAGFSIQIDGDYIKVVGLSSKGKADMAGLYIGDVIIHLNGNKVESKESVSKVFKDAFEGSTYILKVLRDGEEKEIALNY